MKHLFTFCFMLWTGSMLAQQGTWEPASPKICSEFAEQINPEDLLGEYPRPQLVRDHWQNLNGLWAYSTQPLTASDIPESFRGQILVPFPIESALSGVGKPLGKDEVLWYKRTVRLDPGLRKQDRILLHFGAVDWKCTVYVNGEKAGEHEGGYDPFTLDITAFLKAGLRQEIAVSVWDPTDAGPQPRGKQVHNPGGIWYTPVSGIWQTVWLEGVAESYITSTRHTPDVDHDLLRVSAELYGSLPGDQLQISAWDGKAKIAETTIEAGRQAELHLSDPTLWSPDNPHLYDLEIRLIRSGRTLDKVRSYFAMRKISIAPDARGIQRILLNDSFVFQYGPLDQGWWPGGLYTAPSDEALQFDVLKTKEMGFNMIRKHIKVEPARWYYHCDREGILVWQDMPSGDLGGNHWDMHPGKISGKPLEKTRTERSESIYRKEWKAIIDALYNFPCIVVWVPFNEAWGQFKTEEITRWTMAYDSTRLVNSASGGNYFPSGHILDIHNYPDAVMPDPGLFGSRRALVLGEFGGLGLPIEGHTWQNKDNWGYQSFKDQAALQSRYEQLIHDLSALIPKGLSAAVYTQTTDVEIETNGLMTYDRRVIKIPTDTLRRLHRQLYLQ